MPRRQFVNDFRTIRPDSLPNGIHSLEQGEDDGQFTFNFSGDPSAPLPQPVTVTALITDLDEYPKSHEYMLFSDDDAPLYIGTALQDVRGTARKPVIELIGIVSAALTKAAPDKDGDTEMGESQGIDDEDSLNEEDDDQDDIYDSDHEAFGGNAGQATSAYQTITTSSKVSGSTRAFRARIRSDLVATKRAGFKVGQVGHLMEGLNCFVSVSIRMSKLGISHEAMRAWQMSPEEYLILIIQYPNGYKTSEELQALDSLRLAPNLGFRVCASKHYKPTLQEAIQAFTVVSKADSRDNASDLAVANAIPQAGDVSDGDGLRETFISKPLNSLLQERLVPILRSRAIGMTWRGAEEWYVESASRGPSNADGIPDAFFEPESPNEALPDIVNADHFASGVGKKSFEKSFPLLAMQFLLRHFVRCTDFCLVCHRPLETEVEAIKPYVCDQPLCLYQYMTLGFGPSIEHEILSQPYVVDLLISFCYVSAAMRKLKEFPDGLALTVPPVNPLGTDIPDQLRVSSYQSAESSNDSSEANKKSCSNCATYEVGLDPDKLEMIFHDKPERCPVRRGTWIVFKASEFRHGEMHCRVADVTYYPTIKIGTPITMSNRKTGENEGLTDITWDTPKISGTSAKTITPATTPKWINATFQVYEQDFEELQKHAKCIAICRLLDTLPNVKCVQEYLSRNRSNDLKSWVDRISPAALSLLRWIIASNRACIMQVDRGTATQDTDRVSGMKGYMQFRFAMGAPDKEQRFLTAVRNTKERLGLQYPTIFAWHGSPLHNWHMIIREGLHYKNADHGRAYGDGVYHAKDAGTSINYSGMQYYSSGGTATSSAWPQSLLRINSALAMNEIANAPAEFQSSNPYYVVQNLDWIQTRYLFVQCNPIDEVLRGRLESESAPKQAYPQDPSRTPTGTNRNRVEIPSKSVKVARLAESSAKKGKGVSRRASGQSPLKRLKGNDGFANPIDVEETDDSASDVTDPDDVDILLDEPESEPESDEANAVASNAKTPVSEIGDTDFLPGALDYGTLPLMPVPEYAVSGTTKRLLKELQHLQKVQQSSTLADLGWYIDVDKIENVYQWIVELHSFQCLNPKLPIVSQMKNKSMKSIVLEIRFNKDFPYTPPYVRVVRPRFLTFAQGGGGHIVMGGAMCMELLTNTGWSSVSSMESVLMQVRLAIALSEPPAKLDVKAHGDYGTGEAADGYMRACATHGWTVPPGFKEMAYGMGRNKDL
ncbi:hypothetical protein KC332_g1457 [Hortaea werneckii]|uniref:UBC core domain-containing protein n=2 Tax=Hortaea werneckii TaxID=91943 RepID=A0A3M7IQE3_HORWE|nr:hypothetical protein KC358_g3151 [Hortaea werneckii]OTA29102.1 hypothetical protein BTJ68_09806 [Hortaea werneckii EXF-2000]KAI6850270.1 hypothetical protein KC350_g2186 [Hortaea werneckii]KAI6943240.1 hypothetical protein KC341_g1626 [Hortaea werneckii]KAI6949236.1 hypothetical protein KC348_g1450 [Hortaea werneckii]